MLNEIFNEYAPEEIFNVHEANLFLKFLSIKHYCTKMNNALTVNKKLHL